MGKNVIISTLPNISQNYLPKVNTSNIFANSLVYDDGSSVLINTTTASAFKLDVNGTARTGALTLTGALSGTSATFSGNLETQTNGNSPQFRIKDTDFTGQGAYAYMQVQNGSLYIGNATDTFGSLSDKLIISSTGAASFSSSVTANAASTINGAYPQLILNNPSAGAGIELHFKDNGTLKSKIGTLDDINSWQVYNGGAIRFTINNSGNVGIGTTSPSYKLHVVGSDTGGGGLIYSGNSSSNYSLVVGDYATNTNFHIRGDGVAYLRGNVGIGTTSPSVKLQVEDSSSTSLNTLYLVNSSTAAVTTKQNNLSFRMTDTVGTRKNAFQLTAYSDSAGGNIENGGLIFTGRKSDIDTEFMRIKSNGDISYIGRASSTSYAMYFYSDDTESRIYSSDSSGVSKSIVMLTSGIERMRITSGGDININMPNATDRSLSWYSANGLYQVAAIKAITDPSYNDAGILKFFTAGTSSSGMAERMRITSGGNVEIQAGSLIAKSTGTGTPAVYVRADSGSNNGTLGFGNSTDYRIRGGSDYGAMIFDTAAGERMRITSGGNVYIGSTSGDYGKLDVTVSPSSYTAALGLGVQTNSSEGNSVGISFKTKISLSGAIWENARIAVFTDGVTSSAYGSMAFYTMNATTLTERMRITSVGVTEFKGTDSSIISRMISSSGMLQFYPYHGAYGGPIIQALNAAQSAYYPLRVECTTMTVSGNQTVTGTKSFAIEHPLDNKKTLLHYSTESPKADLIYRGKVNLVDGKADVNIDLSSKMTDGTFIALCRNIQCFTTNETGWDMVKGKVIGNILTIESDNQNCTDEISWMVIGERYDESIKNSNMLDGNGDLIVEQQAQIEEQKADIESLKALINK